MTLNKPGGRARDLLPLPMGAILDELLAPPGAPSLGHSRLAHRRFAWRRARRDEVFEHNLDMDIFADLHAELLVRLGRLLRPQDGRRADDNLVNARPEVVDAISLLERLATTDNEQTTAAAVPCNCRRLRLEM